MEPVIHLLPDAVAQQIAAGEVVERPAAVVKELVENAVDAGARLITVEIENGGKTAIRVSDDGCGIARDQVALAFARHATSKLQTAEELFAISHLGFRGEALCSVAAVAKVELLTKRRRDEAGSRITAEGGVLGSVTDAGCPDGTTVCVNDLFFNTPARLKFLRAASSESAAIGQVMTRIMLAHPEIAFRFIAQGKTVAATNGDGSLKNTVFAVLGKDVAAHMAQVKSEGEISVVGMVGLPAVSRSNRSWEFAYVNGRPVLHPGMAKAVENAFGTTLMGGKFPAFVLDIRLPFAMVDVNVHPNKLEVRFADEQRIYAAVNAAVRQALIPAQALPVDMRIKPPVAAPAPAAPATERSAVEKAAFREYRRQVLTEQQKAVPFRELLRQHPEKPPMPTETAEQSAQPAESKPCFAPEVKKPEPRQNGTVPESQAAPGFMAKAVERAPEWPASQPSAQPRQEQQSMAEDLPNPALVGRLLGVAFDTYALVEHGDELLLIDQHAAHERLLYDRYLAAVEKGRTASQQLLLPRTMELNYDERLALEENQPLLQELGFEIELFGASTCQIRALPFLLGQVSQEELVRDTLDTLASRMKEHLKEKIMQTACKHAVKGGDTLDKREMEELLSLLSREKAPLSCPHGRPICLRLTRRELEKQFKRVL